MNGSIKKLHVKETIEFAINTIPQVDKATLEKFLDLVNTNGNYGEISHDQLLSKMCLALKYVPHACANSLLILADLLEIPVSIEADYASIYVPALLGTSTHQATAMPQLTRTSVAQMAH